MSSSVFIDVTDLLFFVDLESFNACFCCVSSVLSFDLANHLNTAPELVDRVYNRPTLETLETKSIQGAVEPHNIKVCVCVCNACRSAAFVVRPSRGLDYDAAFVVSEVT